MNKISTNYSVSRVCRDAQGCLYHRRIADNRPATGRARDRIHGVCPRCHRRQGLVSSRIPYLSAIPPHALKAIATNRPLFMLFSVVCGGNCFQHLDASADLIQPSRVLFPSASQFSTYIPADTGHLINGHFSAAQTYQVIEQWIGA